MRKKRHKRRGRDREQAGQRKPRPHTAMFAVLLITAGAAVAAYPAVSNYFAEKSQESVIEEHDSIVDRTSREEIMLQWEEAREYNETLAGDPVHDPFVLGSGYALPENYTEMLNLDDVMCTLEIPRIDLKLPVYHGTGEDVLEKGVGHLEMTSLPIGGRNCHAVLTGHRGLPSAELFTRLDEMKIGDQFYIHVLDEIHAYQVDQIEVVKPDELAKLVPKEGRDLVTLVTCTPYGINSHRLLIRGTRVPYDPGKHAQEKKKETEKNEDLRWLLLTAVCGAGAIGMAIAVTVKERRRRGKQRGKSHIG